MIQQQCHSQNTAFCDAGKGVDMIKTKGKNAAAQQCQHAVSPFDSGEQGKTSFLHKARICTHYSADPVFCQYEAKMKLILSYLRGFCRNSDGKQDEKNEFG